MTLITRGEKGSKLTIEEMDDNLVHLNNNPLLLGKITADLTLPVGSKIILITGCMEVTGTLFQVGETVTFKYAFEDTTYGTGVVTSVAQYGTEKCRPTQFTYALELEQLSFSVGDLPSLTIEGNTSGATSNVSSLEEVSSAPSQAIALNPNGELFKINEILLTGIVGTPVGGTECSVRTGQDNLGELVAILQGAVSPFEEAVSPIKSSGGIDLLTDPNQWIQMEVRYEYLVGNTLYFSVNTSSTGKSCTVDVYVFGYTIK
jgi:hypothetical protein